MTSRTLFSLLTTTCLLLSTSVSGYYYLNNGVAKFIAGIAVPLDVDLTGGSISYFTNFQAFYKVPDNISYYEPYRVLAKRSVKNTFNRYNVYLVLEKFLDRLGYRGSECIYRLICELSIKEIDMEENGLVGKALNILVSPENDAQLGLTKYKNARWHGLYNESDCSMVYEDCYISQYSVLFGM